MTATQHVPRPPRAARARLLIALAAVPLALASAPVGSWTVANPPADPGVPKPSFTDVSCPTDTACVAAGPSGASGSGIVTAGWDGVAWRTLPVLPLPGGGASPGARGIRIDCGGPTDCALVANVSGAGRAVALLAHWDGTAWTSTAAAPTPPAPAPEILDVACGAPGSCLAVGLHDRQSGERFTQRWDGRTWTEAPAPPAEPDLYRWQFQSRLSCPSATACGFLTEATFPDVRMATSVQLWDGTAWTTTPAPIAPDGLAVLTDIDCTTTANCLAVGWRLNTGAIAMRWDGTQWRSEILSAALPLAALSCVDVRCLGIAGTTLGTALSTTATVAGVVRSALSRPWTVTSSKVADAGFVSSAVSCTPGGCLVVGSRTVGERTEPAAVRFRFPATMPDR